MIEKAKSMPLLCLLALGPGTAAPFAQEIERRGDERFQRMDKNGDGRVSREEFPERLKRLFDRIDSNGDGALTLEEDRAFRKSRASARRGSSRRDSPRSDSRRRLPENVVLRADIPYAGTDNLRQKLDLLVPRKRKTDRPLPVIAFIHGGAWRAGDKRSAHGRLAGYVGSGEFAGVSIGYRLSQEKIWPAQIHDCKAAVRWIHANAKKHGLDAERIAVWGSSAGGHLAAVLGVSSGVGELEGDLGPHAGTKSDVKCVVDFFGPTDFLRMNDFPGRMDHDAADSPESQLVGGPIQRNKDAVRAASPLTYVTKDDADFLIVHGSKDPLVPFNQSEILHAALKEAGVHSTLIKVDGAGHGFRSPEVGKRVRAFIGKHLLGEEATIGDETIDAGERRQSRRGPGEDRRGLDTARGLRERSSAQGAGPPNVVVILTDDQGWGDLSLNGNTDLATPNIDGIARDGARFERFYVCPVCSPTRAEFLTGRYHPRSGVYSTSAGGERMDLDETTIADIFKAAGYATGAFGKWHNGMQYPYHPNGRGFGEFYGFCSGHWGDYFSPQLERNGRLVRGEGFVIDDFTDKAMAFMERNRDGPFFAYLPYNTPHSPMQVPDRWWNKFRNRELKMHHRDPEKENPGHQRAALAMCENIDWNVGRLLNKLEQLGLAKNTIVVYFCDNGPNGWRWNGGMKGRKGSTDEGGVRSPLLIRWHDRIPAGTIVPGYGGAIDLLPTLADLAGIEVRSARPLDGISLKPALLGEAPVDPERLLFSCWRNRVSLRSGPYRLDHRGKLYDLAQDPGQNRDLSSEKREVAGRLRKAVAHWRETVLSELGRDTRPFLIGHPDYRYTQIPARDGKASGQIRRSNRFPNCSYFTDWTRVEDSITWNAEVGEGGRYEVELHYACPPGDEGAAIELSFDEARLRGKITEPHDPPIRGGEHDRVPRGESYVKDFKPLKLGVIELKKGRGTLTLRALEKPGGQIMEFRLLMLTRVDS